ncbi:MAG: hypothetical protein JKY12_06985 [Sneathiella sp.]|nr:hypothetical protein [Sneathiella sp.]
MVNPVNGNNSVYASQIVSQAYGHAGRLEEIEKPVSYDSAVQVDLSDAAKAISETVGYIDTDPFNVRGSEMRLKDLMDEIGMAEDAEVSIRVNSDGSFEVEGEDPLTTLLEEKLNDGSEPELANSLKGFNAGSIFQRVAGALAMASDAAKENPNNAEEFFNWVQESVNPDAKSMDYEVTFSNGKLSGSFLNDEGYKIASTYNLKLPLA